MLINPVTNRFVRLAAVAVLREVIVQHLLDGAFDVLPRLRVPVPVLYEDAGLLRFEALEEVAGGVFHFLLLRFSQLVFFEEVEEFQFFLA